MVGLRTSALHSHQFLREDHFHLINLLNCRYFKPSASLGTGYRIHVPPLSFPTFIIRPLDYFRFSHRFSRPLLRPHHHLSFNFNFQCFPAPFTAVPIRRYY